jgi:hypothetical protein
VRCGVRVCGVCCCASEQMLQLVSLVEAQKKKVVAQGLNRQRTLGPMYQFSFLHFSLCDFSRVMWPVGWNGARVPYVLYKNYSIDSRITP